MKGQHDNLNGNCGVVADIQDMVSAIGGNNNNHQEDAENRVMGLQGEFGKSRPLVLRGIMDPMIAEEWLCHITSMNYQKVHKDLNMAICHTPKFTSMLLKYSS